jgi:hypothetical protein
MFGLKKTMVIRDWRKFHGEELHDLSRWLVKKNEVDGANEIY